MIARRGDSGVVDTNVAPLLERAVEEGRGVLRLAPCWVPRSFLHPGRRLKLHPHDLYAFGVDRGGIDERWFASTTEAANEGRRPDEGLSYVVIGDERALLRDVIAEGGAAVVGDAIWSEYGRWPVYSKFFDNMGPIPLHMHQSDEQAALVGQEGKPEAYYFPPQHNRLDNAFPYTFFGLTPGTTRDYVVRCLDGWNRGDNRILEHSAAYRLAPGTGWLIPPGVLHAPGSFCTYEPQWGSDVFGMYQNIVEGRAVPWSLLVKDMPAAIHEDPAAIVAQLDWDANVDPDFKRNHYIEPIVADGAPGAGYVDKWITYGRTGGRQCFTAKELTVEPGASVTVRDEGAFGLVVVQGAGCINGLAVSSPALIRFNDLTDDEVFVTATAAREGVRYESTSEVEPLVTLRYFGPQVNPGAPDVGDHRQR